MKIAPGFYYMSVVIFLQSCADGRSGLPRRIGSSASDVVTAFAETCMGGGAHARAAAVLSSNENSCILSSDSNCREKKGQLYQWAVSIQGRKDFLAEFGQESDELQNKKVTYCRFYFYDDDHEFKDKIFIDLIHKYRVAYKYNVIWGPRDNFEGLNDGRIHILSYIDKHNFESYVRSNAASYADERDEIEQYWKYNPGYNFSINYVIN